MNPTVETNYGRLEGREENGLRVFRGIPFAAGVSGARRWHAPQRPLPWAGVREATSFGTSALQSSSMLGPMLGLDFSNTGEDCLFLNVWTPACDGARRPVMVWIHGGAYTIGSGAQTMYNGETLARRGDLVVVTINYRLGSFGFLHLNEISDGYIPATGNEGLLDQIAALEWVRDEIAAFGGDPERVTVFGESAGSFSVSTLLGTPRAQGLFRGAIMQSGSANFVANRERANDVAEALLKELKVERTEASRLMQVPAADILSAQQRLHLKMQSKKHPLAFAPVVDGAVLPQHPFAAIAGGLSKSVSILAGTNLDEMKLFGLMDAKARSLDEASLLDRCQRIVAGADAHGVPHGRRAVEIYRDARGTRGQSIAPPDLWFAIDSDRLFRSPAMRLAELQATHQPHTYAYLFTWTSPFLDGALGACHGLEVPFVFGTHSHPMIGRFTGSGPQADRLGQNMQDAWISFAHCGQPGRIGFEEWTGYDRARRRTMVFNAECAVDDAPYEAERSFWESV